MFISLRTRLAVMAATVMFALPLSVAVVVAECDICFRDGEDHHQTAQRIFENHKCLDLDQYWEVRSITWWLEKWAKDSELHAEDWDAQAAISEKVYGTESHYDDSYEAEFSKAEAVRMRGAAKETRTDVSITRGDIAILERIPRCPPDPTKAATAPPAEPATPATPPAPPPEPVTLNNVGVGVKPSVKGGRVSIVKQPPLVEKKRKKHAKRQPDDKSVSMSPETARTVGTLIDIGIGVGLGRVGHRGRGGDDRNGEPRHTSPRAVPRD